MSGETTVVERAAAIRLLVLDVDGVLTDGRLIYGNNGEELKAFSARDGLGIKMLMASGVAVAIITARESAIVARRSQELGVRHCLQGSTDKLASLKQLCDELNIDATATAYMGDDLPDLVAMETVALPLTVADGAAPVRATAQWTSQYNGGYGAVREACEMLMDAQNTLDAALRHFSRHADPA